MAPRLFLLVIVLLFKGIIGQRYILKSDSPNLDGSKICPRNIQLICVGTRVLVLYWNATTTDGRELVLASHSGGQEDYQIETHLKGISYNITPNFVFPYQDESFFNVNATIVIELSSIVKQNIIGFSCGSTSHALSSNLYSTNVTVIGQPPSPSITGCCHPSTSISSDPITCSFLSNTEVSFSWPPQYSSRYHIQRYRVVYDGRLVAPECLSSYFASPNQTCNFSGLNDRTEYTFSISALNCGDQESPTTNLTISLAPQAPNAGSIKVRPTYQNQYLSRIAITWSIPTELCPNMAYSYTIVLLINGSNIVDSMNTSCSRADTNCQVIFEISSNSTNIYDGRIEALNDQGVVVSTTSIPEPIDGFSSVNPNITVDFRACTVKCYSSFTNGTCEVQYIQNLLQGSVNGTVGSEIIAPTLQPGMILFNATFEVGEEIYNLRQNSTIIRYDVKWSNEILACTIIAAFFIILSFISIILIVIVLYTKWKKSESLQLKVIVIVITVFSAFLLLASLIIWIAGLVEVGKLDNCENRNIPNGLLIAALVISIFSCLLDLLIAIVLVYMVKCSSRNVVEEKSKEQQLLEHHGATSLDINEKGISDAESNVVHAHRRIQESKQDAQIRVKTEITDAVVKKKSLGINEKGISDAEDNVVQTHRGFQESRATAQLRVKTEITDAVLKIKETNPNIYDTTEQVGRGPNRPAAPHGSSEYSRLERENDSGANDSAKLKEEQYLPLDRNIPGTSDRPLVNTNATITTTSSTAETGDQYGKLNGDQVKSTGLLGLLRRSAPETEEVLRVSTEGDHSGSTQGHHGGSTALSQSKSSQRHRGGSTQGHRGGSTQEHGGSTQGRGGSTQGRGGSTQGRGGSTQEHRGSTQKHHGGSTKSTVTN